jgi:hypothetical protein
MKGSLFKYHGTFSATAFMVEQSWHFQQVVNFSFGGGLWSKGLTQFAVSSIMFKAYVLQGMYMQSAQVTDFVTHRCIQRFTLW